MGWVQRRLRRTSNIKQTQIMETKVVKAGMLRLPMPVPVLCVVCAERGVSFN